VTDLAALLLPFADEPADQQIVVLCHLVADAVPIDAEELNGAIRRAELLLATGGDPRRPLELDGRAVTALASDLDSLEGRAALHDALAVLVPELAELPELAAVLQGLLDDDDLAWRGLAAALLANELAS
jgi:hypothetical protein